MKNVCSWCFLAAIFSTQIELAEAVSVYAIWYFWFLLMVFIIAFIVVSACYRQKKMKQRQVTVATVTTVHVPPPQQAFPPPPPPPQPAPNMYSDPAYPPGYGTAGAHPAGSADPFRKAAYS